MRYTFLLVYPGTQLFNRYILWCMGKFRQGLNPAQFAHPPKPKKKIRGYVAPPSFPLCVCSLCHIIISHGPAVQNGKRIRSKRR